MSCIKIIEYEIYFTALKLTLVQSLGTLQFSTPTWSPIVFAAVGCYHRRWELVAADGGVICSGVWNDATAASSCSVTRRTLLHAEGDCWILQLVPWYDSWTTLCRLYAEVGLYICVFFNIACYRQGQKLLSFCLVPNLKLQCLVKTPRYENVRGSKGIAPTF